MNTIDNEYTYVLLLDNPYQHPSCEQYKSNHIHFQIMINIKLYISLNKNLHQINTCVFIIQPNRNRNPIHKCECFQEIVFNVIINNLFELCRENEPTRVFSDCSWRRSNFICIREHFTSKKGVILKFRLFADHVTVVRSGRYHIMPYLF